MQAGHWCEEGKEKMCTFVPWFLDPCVLAVRERMSCVLVTGYKHPVGCHTILVRCCLPGSTATESSMDDLVS